MGAFFKGWRRKVGCVTLVMALSLATLSVRSLVCSDHFELYVVAIGSSRGGVYWVLAGHGEVGWQTMTEEEVRSNIGDMSLAEAATDEFTSGPGVVFWGYVLYWWFVAPLTLLSACLILWKPRHRTQNATALIQSPQE